MDHDADDEEYVDGYIRLASNPPFNIFHYYDRQYPLWDEAEFRLVGQWGGPGSGNYTMSDDDLDSPTFAEATWGSRLSSPSNVGALPCASVGADVAVLFRPAYITAVGAAEFTSEGGVPFIKNAEIGGQPVWDQLRSARGIPAVTVGRWTATLVASFQPEANQDGDPEENVTVAATAHNVGSKEGKWGSAYSQLCTIFAETIRDMKYPEAPYSAHELCHALGGSHTPTGIMKASGMAEQPAPLRVFTPPSLKELREFEP